MSSVAIYLIHAHGRPKRDNYFAILGDEHFEEIILNTRVAFSSRFTFNRNMIKILRMIILVLVIIGLGLFLAERFGVKLPFISK
jgi:hypothetical protein